MSIDVSHADDMERWDDLVDRSPHGTPFHRSGALHVLAEHSGASLHPLVGYKGEEPVGVFPLYALEKGPVTGLFSPPPGLKASYQGPILLDFGELKQRKVEERRRAFVDACLDLAEEEVSPRYAHVRTTPRYPDTRAFSWRGFEASPGYTYVVDLEPGEEELLSAFSSDARRNVRNGHGERCEIREGGPAAIEEIIAQVRARHEEQGESYGVTADYVIDLYEALPDGAVRPYVCTVDDEFAGGTVALEGGDTIYRWQGGAKPGGDVPVNDLVDWHIMREAMGRGRTRYDLVGANNRRISRYKAKFAPALREYHELERSSPVVSFAAGLYARLR